MAKRKFNRNTVVKKKRNVMRRRRATIARGPFPVTKIAKMRLVMPKQQFTCTSGALARLGVQANRPYSGTNYAYGWNQWAALYNTYIVLGSKCNVYYSAYDSTTSVVGMMGIYLSDDTTNFTTYTSMIEAKRGTWRMIGVQNRPIKAVSKYSAKKHYNIKDVKDNSDRLGATMTAGPTDAAYYNVWFQPQDESTGVTYNATIIVDYIVLFSEPKDVAAS